MNFVAYHLNFTSPLHMGLEGIGQERIETTIHSDTLWGALVQQWALLYDEKPSDLAADPPFDLSSCFLLHHGKRFYPVPLGSLDDLFNRILRMEVPEQIFDSKKIKRIKYLREDLFLSWLSGKFELSNIKNILLKDNHYPPIIQDNRQDALPFSESQRPRVRIDRLSNSVEEGGFFYCTDQFWWNGAGLFFLACFKNEVIQSKFDASLTLLGDTGLGADRSIGRGNFSFSSQSVDFPSVISPKKWILLSLYHPTPEEISAGILSTSAYQLTRRIGHAGCYAVGRLRRPDLWMLEEGAILGSAAQGDIPLLIRQTSDVAHPVFRYGRAFTVPVAS
ncbi:MAG: hypothetical protein A4E72_00415 [Syntrophus sp. PtaU1.Bin208]|nr:MAG: hypothetical protein A4E72_00415 [Syntrophus sp. PtaU1.Bin208]